MKEKIGLSLVLVGAAFYLTVFLAHMFLELWLGWTIDGYRSFQILMLGGLLVFIGYALASELPWKIDGRLKTIIDGKRQE